MPGRTLLAEVVIVPETGEDPNFLAEPYEWSMVVGHLTDRVSLKAQVEYRSQQQGGAVRSLF